MAPSLTLLPEDAGQRRHEPRDVFDGLRYIVKTGAPWRWMPHDLPPRPAVYRQARRWPRAGCFEALVHDPRARLRRAAGRAPAPSAAVLDGRTLRSGPESGARSAWDGAERRRGSKVHMAADTPGHPLAPHVTPAAEQDRARAGPLAEAVQAATGGSVEPACVDRAHTGDGPAGAAAAHGIRPEVVEHTEPERGFVPPPRRWVAERSFARAARFRRSARDHERLPETLAGFHFAAFAGLMLKHAALAEGP